MRLIKVKVTTSLCETERKDKKKRKVVTFCSFPKHSNSLSYDQTHFQGMENAESKTSNEDCLWCTEDVIYEILTFLTPRDLSLKMNVCVAWKNLIRSDNSLWKPHCCYVFPKIFKIFEKRALEEDRNELVGGNNVIQHRQDKKKRTSTSGHSILDISRKYENSLYKYYKMHKKIRFDGVYIVHVVYYIESEMSVHSIEHPKNYHPKPYQKIEYFRYLRFFPPKLKWPIFNKNNNNNNKKNNTKLKNIKNENKNIENQIAENMSKNLLTKDEFYDDHYYNLKKRNNLNKLLICSNKKEDIIYPVIYSYCKEKPSCFHLFPYYKATDKENNFLSRIYSNNKNHCLEYKQRFNGIIKEEKIYLGEYFINNEKNKKEKEKEKDKNKQARIIVDVNTDYGVKLVLGFTIDETVNGRSDRLNICQFDRYSINQETKEIIFDQINAKVEMPIRHEPFFFIPDTMFDDADDYFN